MTESDEPLVARAREGDRAALDALARKHWDQAWRTAAAITGSRQLTEDAVQEAFARVSRSLSAFDGRARFSTWLTRIVVNCAIDAVRTETRDGSPPPEAAPAAWTDFEIPDPVVGRALANLTHERRVVVVLHYWVDLTTPEIADALEIPLGTVNSRLSRALEQLRQTLGDDQ